MYSNHQLRQIWQNGQRTTKARPLGPLFRRLVDDRARNLAARREIRELVADISTQDFQLHCSVGPCSGGRLVVLVDDPRRLHAMRVRWLYPMLQHLRREARKSFVERIEFRLGESESRFTVDGPVTETGEE